MKRIRLLVLLWGVVAVALPLGAVFAGGAGATEGSGTTTNSVTSKHQPVRRLQRLRQPNLTLRYCSLHGRQRIGQSCCEPTNA